MMMTARNDIEIIVKKIPSKNFNRLRNNAI